MYDYTETTTEIESTLNSDSLLFPYADVIKLMLDDGKPITAIFATIKTEGFTGSYSLLQQHCARIKPITQRNKKSIRKIKRRELVTIAWSDKTDLSDKDISYIEANHPVFIEIKKVISDFRTAYTAKDIESVKLWCETHAQSDFPVIRSFINGINSDSDAFCNSMKYTYSNGLLEGCVNKLKAVKRSMYGRAGYALLRAKLLLAQVS
jgi:transposase